MFQLASQVRGIPRLVVMAAGDNLQLSRSYTVLVIVGAYLYTYICKFTAKISHIILYMMSYG